MNWYKKAKIEDQAAYETFGLEDAIINGFKQLYGKLLDKYSTPESKQQLQKLFEEEGGYFLGTFILPKNIMKLIFNKYGEPKFNTDKIYLDLSYSKNHGAFFGVNTHGEFIIGKQSLDIFDVYYSAGSYQWFEDSLKHEIQHLIRRLYNKKDMPKDEFMMLYGRNSEIQAYSYNIALAAMNTIKELYQSAIKFSDPLKILNKLKTTQSDLIKNHVFFELKEFFAPLESRYKTTIPKNIKDQYYISTAKDFGILLDKWIKEQVGKNELV